MTEPEKKRYAFPIKYNPDDFIKVLSEKPMKNSMVKAALEKVDKKKYKGISAERVKQILIKLREEGKISGGKDEDLGFYLWRKQE